MRQTRGMRLWSVLYPIFLYFAVCQILSTVQEMLPFTAGWDAVMRQGVDTAGGLLVLYISFLKKGRPGGKLRISGGVQENVSDSLEKSGSGKRGTVDDYSGSFGENGRVLACETTEKNQQLTGCILAALMLGCGSFALNNLLALTDLLQRSAGYQFVEQSFYSSSLFWEIAVLCILTPVTEELLYRRIVFCELRGWIGRWGAVFVSAFTFGVMHMNIVQMIYAFGLGLLLGILMERYGDVRAAMCGHITANLLSVLRSELGWLTDFQAGSSVFWVVTIGALVISLGLAGWCVHKALI